MEGKRGSECLLKPVSNIDFNPKRDKDFGMNGKYDESAHADLADLAKLF